MKPYAQEAENLRLLLKAEIVSIDDVVAWADEKISTLPEYDDDLTEISLGAKVLMDEMDRRLRRASIGADTIESTRNLLGRMHDVLVSNELRAREFAKVLDSLSGEIHDELPEDLTFMLWIYDCFLDPDSWRGEPIDIVIDYIARFVTRSSNSTQVKTGKSVRERLLKFFRGRRK